MMLLANLKVTEDLVENSGTLYLCDGENECGVNPMVNSGAPHLLNMTAEV
jgi:hypothetical protein